MTGRLAPRSLGDRWFPRAILALVVAGAALAVMALAARSPAGAQSDQVTKGRQLYQVGCISCHGINGLGVKAGDDVRGPSLVDAGEAAAYYQLSTGRMPLLNPNEQAHRNRPVYPPDEQAALVAYVASLGNGPELPKVDITGADLAEGGGIYRSNCQACHGASGAGGALSYGRAAPPLDKAEPEQIAGAIRSGPGQMPVFGPSAIDQRQLDDLAGYVEYLKDPRDPGGVPMGRIGPVPEGFVAWSVGIVLLLASVFWIGTRSPIRRRRT